VRSCIHFRKAGRQGWGPYLPEHEIKSGELLIFMIGWAMVLEAGHIDHDIYRWQQANWA
jgi:hypothetical protein